MAQGSSCKKSIGFLKRYIVCSFFSCFLYSSAASAAAYISSITDQGSVSPTANTIRFVWASNTHYYLYLKVKLEGSSTFVTKASASNAPSSQYFDVALPEGTHLAYLRRCARGTMGPTSCSNSGSRSFSVTISNAPVIENFYAFAQDEFTRSYQTTYSGNSHYYLWLQSRIKGSSSFSDIGGKTNATTSGNFNHAFTEGIHELRLHACKRSSITGEPINCEFSEIKELSVTLVHSAPTISSVANVSGYEDVASTVSFTIGDDYTSTANLALSVSTTNSTFGAVVGTSFGGSGANRTLTLTPPANKSGSIDVTIKVTDGPGKYSTRTFKYTANPVNDSPTISYLANKTINEDQNTGSIGFSVADIDTSVNSLTLSADSSNTSLVPLTGIVFGGSGSNRTVVVTPSGNQFGSSTIVVIVSDGERTSAQSFLLTVNNVNDSPTISSISNKIIGEDSNTGDIGFTVGDLETPAASLTVTASSNNTSLVQNGAISLGGSGSSRTVRVTPSANQFGLVTITLVVSDGELSKSESFSITVNGENDAPIISGLGSYPAINEDSGFTVHFNVSDVETPAGSLSVSATSSNTGLLSSFNFGGSNGARTLQIQPNQNQYGSATVTVTVSDGNVSSSDFFNVEVNPINDGPSIAPISDITINENTSNTPVNIEVHDIDTIPASLTVTATSDNANLLPNESIVVTGNGETRSLALYPAADKDGTSTITVRVIDDHGAQASQTFLLTVVNVPKEVPNVPIYSGNLWNTNVNPAGDVGTSDYYGGVSGSYNIGSDGSFQYSVPIEVPPGFQGMQPNLSLSYHSSRKNGLVGWGWSLSGLPKIHKCDADYFRDGHKADLTEYCLNGERLVQTGLSNYRTEHESFIEITKHSNYWSYVDQQGIQYRLGFNLDSRETGRGGSTYAWHLDREKDIFGNYYSISYETGELGSAVYHRPASIQYTLNDEFLESGPAVTDINFIYTERNDDLGWYKGNEAFIETKRLSRIDIKQGERLLWDYRLHYQDETGEPDPAETSRLYTIDRCFGTDACQAEAQFTSQFRTESDYVYSHDTSNLLSEVLALRNAEHIHDANNDGVLEGFYKDDTQSVTYTKHVGYGDEYEHTITPKSDYLDIDINNDGYMDIIRINPTTIGVEVYINNNGTISSTPISSYGVSSGYLSVDTERTIKKWYFQCGGCGSQPGWQGVWYHYDGSIGYDVKFIDFNGDGLIDLLRMPPSCGSDTTSCSGFGSRTDISLLLNTGTGWVKSSGAPQFTTIYSNWDEAKTETTPQFVDLNGDGYPDIYSAGSNFEFNGDPDGDYTVFTLMNQNGTALSGLTEKQDHKDYLGDFDGDGYIDYARVTEMQQTGTNIPTISVRRSSADNYATSVPDADYLPSCASGYHDQAVCQILVLDFNGDGLDDIVQQGGCNAANDAPDGPGHLEYKAAVKSCNDWLEGLGYSQFTEQVWISQGVNEAGEIEFSEPIIFNEDIYAPSARERVKLAQFFDHNGDGIIENSLTHRSNLEPMLIKNVLLEKESIRVDYKGIDLTSWLKRSGGAFSGDEGFKDSHALPEDFFDVPLGRVNMVQPAVTYLSITHGSQGVNTFNYSYKGAKFDTASYGHLGFEEISATRHWGGGAPYDRTVTEYHQKVSRDYALTGVLKRKRVYASEGLEYPEQLLSDTRYQWQVRLYEPNTAHNPDSNPRYFPYIVETTESKFDLSGDAMSTSRTNNRGAGTELISSGCTQLSSHPSVLDSVLAYTEGDQYDTDYNSEGVLYKTVTTVCDAANDDISSPVAMVNITGSYTDESDITSKGLRRGLVEKVSQVSWIGPEGSTPEGDLLSSAILEADSSASCDVIASNTSVWLKESEYTFNDDGTLHSETSQPNAGSGKTLTKTYGYDTTTGSVNSITESWNNTSGDVSLNFSSRTTLIDETFNTNGQRVVTTTNPLEQVTTVTYHEVFGSPVSSVDINNLTSSYDYDALGRIIYTQLPNNVVTHQAYHACDYCFPSEFSAEQRYIKSYVATKTSGQPMVKEYIDRLGRSMGKETVGYDGTPIYTSIQYREFGKVGTTVAPMRLTEVQQKTRNFYDVLTRPTEIRYPNQESSFISYHGLKTIHTNVNDQTQTRYGNAAGLVLRNIDNEGTPVDFQYWPSGQLKTTQVGGSSHLDTRVCMAYDALGRKTMIDDPNTGRYIYRYNALGLLASQIDANNQVTRFTYDKLGRMTSRTDDATGAALVHAWSYDEQMNGLADGLTGKTTNGGAYSESYGYNAYGQRTAVTASYEGKTYATVNHYDAYGRAKGTTYPGGYAVANIYNSFGFLEKVVENTQNQILWEANEVNDWGQVTEATLGDTSVVSKEYVPETGRIDRISSMRDGLLIMDQDYDWDPLGNLKSRTDYKSIITEAFCYDDLNRLKASRMGSCTESDEDYSYNVLGNIVAKAGVTGSYSYGTNAGPHAVTGANGLTYQYDNNGNLTTSKNASGTVVRSIGYSTFNKPMHMSKGVWSTDIVYGATQSRVKRVDKKSGATQRTTYYFGNLFEEVFEADGTSRKIYYIGDFAQRVEESGIGSTYHEFLHKDHLGSTVAKTRDIDLHIPDTLFDAWGNRLTEFWGSSVLTNPAYTDTSVRGFTGHEHIDPIGLIHMNGRVYDPELGRFLSPDPVVQAPYNTQSYNRYSYVLNNPLSLVDPSGYCYDDTVLLHTMAMDAAEVSVKTAIINYRINLTRNYYRLLNLYRGAVQQYVENFDRYGQSTNFDIGDINIGVSFVKPRSYFDYIGMQFAANGVLPDAQKAADQLLGGIIDAGGDVDALRADLSQLPPEVLAKLHAGGVKFVAVKDSITEYLSHLKGVRPRGWSPGKTWDIVPGIHSPEKNAVVIATSGKYSHGSYNLALHETGHAFDAISGRASSSAAFKSAYRSSYGSLGSYYRQPGVAGLQETYAESFANFYGGNQFYHLQYPSLNSYWSGQ